MDKYIIVGRKVDGGGTKFLHHDGSVTTDPAKAGAAGRALDVEFIGKTVVELSRGGPLDENSPEYQKAAEVLRQAMAVLPMDPTHDLNDPEIERIHDNIQVKLVWDQRVKNTDEDDANTRTLVVPVQDTLAEREDYFSTQINQPGFEPPLTYTLDQLMIKHFFDGILDEAMNEAQTTGTDLPDATKQAIKTRVNALWSQKTSIFQDLGSEDEEEDPTRKSMARILTSPVSAFHRAVGIYITNMCD
ncbi:MULTISPECIES: hypothetical protein [Roseobacteraceae]|uniref:Uncharacterized protein n=1 Tax=Falsiruegeria litorea TaxID=1280831 RepID=A0ABS5WW45_9RHOB|nr:hypothetical protein [Falsiruegeria litorea]MBT3143360.1 hypothetical protein [Falsiruegeria litorea]MBT8169816.1 hypothetical protein [Falsiruegeria litorea]